MQRLAFPLLVDWLPLPARYPEFMGIYISGKIDLTNVNRIRCKAAPDNLEKYETKKIPAFYQSEFMTKQIQWNRLNKPFIRMIYAPSIGKYKLFDVSRAYLNCTSLSSGIKYLNQSNDLHIDHYDDVIMGAMASQITSLMVVYSTDYSDVDQRKHQNSASLAFVRGNHLGPVNSPHKWPVTRQMFPFHDVIMSQQCNMSQQCHMP